MASPHPRKASTLLAPGAHSARFKGSYGRRRSHRRAQRRPACLRRPLQRDAAHTTRTPRPASQPSPTAALSPTRDTDVRRVSPPPRPHATSLPITHASPNRNLNRACACPAHPTRAFLTLAASLCPSRVFFFPTVLPRRTDHQHSPRSRATHPPIPQNIPENPDAAPPAYRSPRRRAPPGPYADRTANQTVSTISESPHTCSPPCGYHGQATGVMSLRSAGCHRACLLPVCARGHLSSPHLASLNP